MTIETRNCQFKWTVIIKTTTPCAHSFFGNRTLAKLISVYQKLLFTLTFNAFAAQQLGLQCFKVSPCFSKSCNSLVGMMAGKLDAKGLTVSPMFNCTLFTYWCSVSNTLIVHSMIHFPWYCFAVDSWCHFWLWFGFEILLYFIAQNLHFFSKIGGKTRFIVTF